MSNLSGQVTDEWVKRYNSPFNSSDEANSIAVDGSGNVYVTGSSYRFDGYSVYTTIKYNLSGDEQWIVNYNGVALGYNYGNAIAVDILGNVYVTGRSGGNGNSYDCATIKYNSDGVEQWINRYNNYNNGYDGGIAIAVDKFGNVFVTGFSILNGNYADYLTIKYNTAGIEQWVKSYNGPSNQNDVANSLAIDTLGNVYVTGYSTGNANDFATVKYDSMGVQKWVQRYNASGNTEDIARSIALDHSGNVYVTGLTAGNGADFVTIKYNSSGTQQWVERFDGPAQNTDQANSLGIDGSGNIYVTGISTSIHGDQDFATIKYNPAGILQWSKIYNGPLNSWDYATNIAVDNSGNVYVTGNSTNFYSIFTTIKYNTEGIQQWLKTYNGPSNSGDTKPTSIATDGSGNVYVTGVSNGSGTLQDFTTIKYSNQNQTTQPSISISPIQINPGGSVSFTGQNFRANAQVKVSVTSSNSEIIFDQVYTTGSIGEFNANYSTNGNSSPGIYSVSCRDIFVNQSAPSKIFEVNEPPETFDLTLTSPNSDTVDRIIDVEWKDKMIPKSGYLIDNIKRYYKYKINYSTDDGTNWSSDIYSEGFEFINTIPVFSKQISLPPLNSIQSGTEIKFKVTDYISTFRFSESQNIPIRNSELTKSNISLNWDYSYPNPGRSPKGVSADGISRLYLKISKNSGSPSISSVTIHLTDDKNNTDINYLGKLKIATITNNFSVEADNANLIQISNSGQIDYWFWYVSPDDFVRNGAGDESKNQRTVTANVKVVYSDATTEYGNQNISIARPPLMFLHGIGSNGYLWNDYGINFIHLFKVIETPSYNSSYSFRDIGDALLNWNNENSYNSLSFQNAVYKMRNAGFATNQVYYISHSMGGNIARAASEIPYYNSKQNYYKGYINRLITMDTPNNGSPIADFVITTLPLINNLEQFSKWGDVAKLAIKGIIKSRLVDLLNSALELQGNSLFSDITPTASLKNLQISGNGSYKFRTTPIKSFLLAGDFFHGENINFSNTSYNFTGEGGFNKFFEYLEKVIEITLYPNLINFFYSSGDKQNALNIFKKVRHISISEKVTKLLELIYNKLFNSNSSIFNSDLIVSVNSQLANTPRTYANTYDSFNGDYGSNFGISHTSLLSHPCTKDTLIRSKIRNLISLPLSYNEFLQTIPQTPSNSINNPFEYSDNLISNSFDTSKVLNILFPEDGHLCIVDSTVNVSFNINDTTDLQYVNISFQGENYYDTLKSLSYSFNLIVNSNELDSSYIHVSAVYLRNDSLVISEDLKNVFIKTLTNPVEFEVVGNFFELIKDDMVFPKYKTVYPNFIYNGNTKDLTAFIDNTSIIVFDNNIKSFKAISTGETFATVSNGSYSDTIYFNVKGEILVPGNTNLKFPADQAFVPTSDLKFSWNIVNYASQYYIQIAEDIDFRYIVYKKGNINDTVTMATDIRDSVRYYWRVKASNSVGSGTWSETRSFISYPVNEAHFYITVIPQGLYNDNTNSLSRKDTVKAYLININSPYNIIDTSYSVLDSMSFQGLFRFPKATDGTYYLKIKHMNCLETWSKAGGENFMKYSTMYYDFTTAQSQSYGDNLVQLNSQWCIYSGDINQDGIIDASDLSQVENDAANSLEGYNVSDLNGDNFVDASDLSLVENSIGIGVINP